MATAPTTVDAAGLSWGPRALLRRLRSGDEIARLVTLVFALSVVLITGLLVYQLWANSAQARHAFGLSFLVEHDWDPVAGHFGALTVHLRHAGYLGARLIDRRSPGLGRGHFSGGTRAPAPFGQFDVFDRSAGRRAQRHLRTAGRFYSRADHAHRDTTRLETHVWGSFPCSKGRHTASAS